MDKRELERALIAIKDKLDLTEVKLQEIEKRLRKLQDDTDYCLIDIETIKEQL